MAIAVVALAAASVSADGVVHYGRRTWHWHVLSRCRVSSEWFVEDRDHARDQSSAALANFGFCACVNFVSTLVLLAALMGGGL